MVLRTYGHRLPLALLCAVAVAVSPAAGSPTAPPPVLPTPNPWLAWLPAEATPDLDTWTPRIEARARQRAFARAGALGPLPEVTETEAAGTTGANDAPFVAEHLNLGTTPGALRSILARGWLRPVPTATPASTEPDNSISEARSLAVATGTVVRIPGVIGDGAYGSGSPVPNGDFDCVELSVAPGVELEVAVVTPIPLGDLDPRLVAWDLAGALLAVDDNLPISGFLTNLDAYLKFDAPASGQVVVCAYGTSATPRFPGDLIDHLLLDPFDGSSGPGFGSEGTYDLWINVGTPEPRDRDVWSVDLRRGDVLGVGADANARRLVVRDPTGAVRVASGGRDLSGLYPSSSSLPGGRGGPAVATVADLDGRWSVEASGVSWFFEPAYSLEFRVDRPPLDEATTPRRQRVLLDVDGALLNREIFGLPPASISLSPLADFLPGWGLGADEFDRLVTDLRRVVDRLLRSEIAAGGGNGNARQSGLAGDFDLEIVDSRAGDVFGEADVLRIVIGGTIPELGASTIGLAEAVDPGNFDTTGTAVVLLDLLSGPATSLNSLNRWRAERSGSWRHQIAEGLGRIAAHEAGHLLAAYHTNRDLGPTQIMDSGGRLDLLLGAGADGEVGTADDVAVAFGEDLLAPNEGLAGSQDSLDAVSFDAPLAGLRSELAIAPQLLSFAAIEVGDSLDLGIVVSAAGGEEVSVAVSLAGASPAYSLPGPAALVVPAGGSSPIVVRFSPATTGDHLATLILETDTQLLEVPLRGVGGLGLPGITPSSLDLGDIEYGPAGSTLSGSLQLTNDGAAAIFVETLALSGADAERFQLEAVGPFAIAAGASVDIDVGFAPAGLVGPRSARAVALVRDAATPRLECWLTARAHGADLALSPASPYFFGIPRPGQTRTRTFRLENVGDRDLTLGSATITGPQAELFEVLAGPTPVLVAPGHQADLTVRFAPLQLGDFTATLSLPTNDPDRNPLLIEMAGVGGGGVAGLIPAAPVDLGEVLVGTIADTVVRLQNVGTLTLIVSSIVVTGPGGAPPSGEVVLLSSAGPLGMSPGNGVDVVLRFAPAAQGLRHAELLVASDDPSAPTRAFSIEGLGLGDPPPPPPGPVPTEIPALDPLGLVMFVLLIAGLGCRRTHRRSSGGRNPAPPTFSA